MNIDKLFPCAMIVLSLLAGAIYLCCGDYRRTVYWFAAAVLTAAVTY